MKRLIITLFAAASVVSAGAQSRSAGSISICYGGFPVLERLAYGEVGVHEIPLHEPSLKSLYNDSKGPVLSSGTFALEADFPVRKWLSIPMIVTGNLVMQKSTSVVDGSSHMTTNVTSHVMSGFRFKYMNKNKVNFYSMVCFGAGLGTQESKIEMASGPDEEHLETYTKFRHYVDFIPGFQIVPFGVRFGKKVYGTAEIGVGTMYVGGMLGIGIKL